MGGSSKKKQGKKKSKGKKKPTKARIETNDDETNIKEDSKKMIEGYDVWKNFICLNKGCTKQGFIRRYCSPMCCQTWYCSFQCFQEDYIMGLHQRLCRNVIGLENVILGTSLRIKRMEPPRGRTDYEHKGLFAAVDLPRGSVILNEVPMIFVRFIREEKTDYRRDERFSDLVKLYLDFADFGYGSIRRFTDHPLKWACAQNSRKSDVYESPDNNSQKTKVNGEKNLMIDTLNHIVKVIFDEDEERVTKFLQSRMEQSMTNEQRTDFMKNIFRDEALRHALENLGCDKDDALSKSMQKTLDYAIEYADEKLNQLYASLSETKLNRNLCERLISSLIIGSRAEGATLTDVATTMAVSGFSSVLMNNSCDPNAIVYSVMDNHLVVALRDIKAGDEITIDDLNLESLVNLKERRDRIKGVLKYHCICDCCENNGIPNGEGGSIRVFMEGEDPDLEIISHEDNLPNLPLFQRYELVLSLVNQCMVPKSYTHLSDGKDVQLNDILEPSVMKRFSILDRRPDYQKLYPLSKMSNNKCLNRLVSKKRHNTDADVLLHSMGMEIEHEIAELRRMIYDIDISPSRDIKSYAILEKAIDAIIRIPRGDETNLRKIIGNQKNIGPRFITVNPFNEIIWYMSKTMTKYVELAKTRDIREFAHDPILKGLVMKLKHKTERFIMPGVSGAVYFAKNMETGTLSASIFALMLLYENEEYNNRK